MEQLLHGLRAIAEETRLRMLGLCAHAELTVTELVEILGQSQPRVSRHLKLLVEAGLLERNQEGNWAYYRSAARTAQGGGLGQLVVDLLPADDPVHALDLERLQAVKQAWSVKAAAYFRRNAADWSRVRALHVDESKVDTALKHLLAGTPIDELLDVGTGTGHVLELLGGTVESAIGIDRSRDMLNVARANLWRAALRNCQVRQADMMRLPFSAGRFAVVTLHMVLHYAERPGPAIAEAARVLQAGGRLVIVDFASHERDELRREHAHLWLGFDGGAIARFFDDAGLVADQPVRLEGAPLTVCLWSARAPAGRKPGRRAVAGRA